MQANGNDDLHGPVRQAVNDVRGASPPADAQTRAMERARKLARPAPRRQMPLWPIGVGTLIGGGAAAVLIVTLLLIDVGEKTKETQPGSSAVHRTARDRFALNKGKNTENDIQLELGETGKDEPNFLSERLDDPAVPGIAEMPGVETTNNPVQKDVIVSPKSVGGGDPKGQNVDMPPKEPVVGAPQDGPGGFQVRTSDRGPRDPMKPVDGSPEQRLPGLPSVPPAKQGVADAPANQQPAIKEAEKVEVEKLVKGLHERMPDKTQAEIEAIVRDIMKQQEENAKGAKVWHRDASQPTVARVYVGNRNSLELVSLQVTVTIDGPRVRTLVDHVFRNPHNQQLEGTFEYPLPPGASPSYFAMFLNGSTGQSAPPRFARTGDKPLPADALAALQPADVVSRVDSADWGHAKVARIVNNDKGREAYEEVVRGRIDPGLLEYAAGNTFRGRVFPIPAHGYNRVILAYEETLPITGGRMLYRYPLPGCKVDELTFTLQADAAACQKVEFPIKEGKVDEKAGHLLCSRTWRNEKPTGDILFSCVPADPHLQAISGRNGDGPLHLYTRIRPEIQAERTAPFAKHGVFLLDTSLSEFPDRFQVSMKLLKAILEQDKDLESFNILTFNVGAAWVEPNGWLPNTPAGRETAFKRLDGLLLEGATDVGAALDKLAKPSFEVAPGTPIACFLLSDGNITWGEEDAGTLVSRFERRCPLNCRFHCYRTGLGAENTALCEALTRRGGGIFQCYGEADIAAAAVAHRHDCLIITSVRFVDGPAAADVLVAGRKAALYPDGDLVVAARFNQPGRTTLVVEGQFQGKKVVQKYPIEIGAAAGSELAPRAWAEVAVASLLALNDPQLDGVTTAYCQSYGIASRTASFLVLENDADYKRFNLEDQGKVLAGDLGAAIENLWQTMAREVTPREAFLRFLDRIEPRVKLLKGPQGAHVRALLALLAEDDFVVGGNDLPGVLLKATPEMTEYLKARGIDRREVRPYLEEAQRRAKAGDVAGAVRVLSSVIEEHAGQSDALRLVGYRLLDMKQAGEAARLFGRVQQQRPFEPHSYRDLARSLEESGHYALAAVNYEVVLAGTWHGRFHEDIKLVAQEEYVHMMQDAIRRKAVSGKLANQFGERLEALRQPQTSKGDLRVSISWNTDNTDVDLWVVEPDGTKCFYGHNRTTLGGQLSQDQTQGYGPERYAIAKAPPGEFVVLVHNFRTNPNLLGGETNVQVVVTKFAGTEREEVKRYTVILKDPKQELEVCRVKF